MGRVPSLPPTGNWPQQQTHTQRLTTRAEVFAATAAAADRITLALADLAACTGHACAGDAAKSLDGGLPD